MKTKIEYVYKTKLGINRKLPTPTIRVLIGEAITTIQAQTILQLTVTTIALTTATSVSVFHSNTFSRLYILWNIYNEGISIKEIYPILI